MEEGSLAYKVGFFQQIKACSMFLQDVFADLYVSMLSSVVQYLDESDERNDKWHSDPYDGTFPLITIHGHVGAHSFTLCIDTECLLVSLLQPLVVPVTSSNLCWSCTILSSLCCACLSDPIAMFCWEQIEGYCK